MQVERHLARNIEPEYHPDAIASVFGIMEECVIKNHSFSVMPLPPSTAVILFAMCFAAMLSVSAPVPTGPLPAFVDELDDSDDF